MSMIDGNSTETKSFARRAAHLNPAGVRPAREDAISFDSGHADPHVLPDLTEEAKAALSVHRSETLQYAPRPGLPALRSWIAAYMNDDGATGVSPENILVVNGAKHGLELVCRLLLDEGDSIVVTSPTYFTAIPIFKSFGVSFIQIPQDADGLDVDELAHALESNKSEGRRQPKFIYDVPDFHNPSGVTMSRERREALIALSAKYGIFIVEDSPYRKVRFEGTSQPSLKSLDNSGLVLTLGTFSKLLAPGLRIGWIAGPQDILNRIVQLKSDGGSCPLTQRLIVNFGNAGRFNAHIQKVQEVYRTHRDRMLDAFRRQIPEFSTAVPHGGYYLWLTLPKSVDGDTLAELAEREGVTVIAGSKFFADHNTIPPRSGSPKNYIRVAYSHATLEQIDEGVQRINRAFRSMQNHEVKANS
jgi:2-aminoadipate transaminase